jgi:hypothetical protein
MIPAWSSLGKGAGYRTLFLGVIDDVRHRTGRPALMILFALDALIDFFAMDGDVLRRVDPDAHLIALHAKNGNRHVVPDHYRLANASGQYQHNARS